MSGILTCLILSLTADGEKDPVHPDVASGCSGCAPATPVEDLRPGDFTVKVDGQPRSVVSADLIRVDRAKDSPPQSPVALITSNVSPINARHVLIAVDPDPHRARNAHAAAQDGVAVRRSSGAGRLRGVHRFSRAWSACRLHEGQDRGPQGDADDKHRTGLEHSDGPLRYFSVRGVRDYRTRACSGRRQRQAAWSAL
jgi:hypothetical protein